MEEKNKIPTPQWKGCIIFGIVNIGLVLLCTKLNVIMLSVSLILLIAAGVVTTIQSIKEDWQALLECLVDLQSRRGCVPIHTLLQKWAKHAKHKQIRAFQEDKST